MIKFIKYILPEKDYWYYITHSNIFQLILRIIIICLNGFILKILIKKPLPSNESKVVRLTSSTWSYYIQYNSLKTMYEFISKKMSTKYINLLIMIIPGNASTIIGHVS